MCYNHYNTFGINLFILGGFFMKKVAFFSILLSMLLLLVSCGDAGIPNITQETTEHITWVDYADNSAAHKMMFSFDLGCDYTKVILAVDGGALISSADEEEKEVAELNLTNGESFYWVPGEGSSDHAIIVIQICNESTTLHCGTLSLVKTYDEKTQTASYRALLDSDDGLNIRGGDGEAHAVIHAE